eukprot:1141678-Pelagomonas_calceolata.AAC.6
MTAEQKEALQGIAGEFNSFQDDGSFMERVRKQQGLMRQQAQVRVKLRGLKKGEDVGTCAAAGAGEKMGPHASAGAGEGENEGPQKG